MNSIVRPVTDLPSDETPRISVEERARRKKAVEYARGSVRLEGFETSEFLDTLHQRYIDGEIEEEHVTEVLLAHYKQ